MSQQMLAQDYLWGVVGISRADIDRLGLVFLLILLLICR